MPSSLASRGYHLFRARSPPTSLRASFGCLCIWLLPRRPSTQASSTSLSPRSSPQYKRTDPWFLFLSAQLEAISTTKYLTYLVPCVCPCPRVCACSPDHRFPADLAMSFRMFCTHRKKKNSAASRDPVTGLAIIADEVRRFSHQLCSVSRFVHFVRLALRRRPEADRRAIESELRTPEREKERAASSSRAQQIASDFLSEADLKREILDGGEKHLAALLSGRQRVFRAQRVGGCSGMRCGSFQLVVVRRRCAAG